MRGVLTDLGTLAAGWARELARAGNPGRGLFIFSACCASCHGEEGAACLRGER